MRLAAPRTTSSRFRRSDASSGRLNSKHDYLGELDDSTKVAAGIQVSQFPDVSHLTPEQLFAEQRILRETRERLEAVHAGKPDPLMIEAAAESVEEVSGNELCP